MPLDHQQSTEEFQLGIWRIDESLEELLGLLKLSETDLSTLRGFKSEYRKREWLTARVLLKVLSPSGQLTVAYDTSGKPYVVDSAFKVSISHTRNYVAVILSTQSEVGIDLETIQSRIEKIAGKFVSEEEEQFIESNKKLDYQHVIWGTKEVLYKIYGKGELHFLNHIHVEKFRLQEKGELMAKIIKGDFTRRYKVSYEKIRNLMLVYALNAKVMESHHAE